MFCWYLHKVVIGNIVESPFAKGYFLSGKSRGAVRNSDTLSMEQAVCTSRISFAYNNSKVILAKATLSSDLATTTGINWVNIATIQAFIDLLKANSYKAETVAFILNDLITLNKMELQC